MIPWRIYYADGSTYDGDPMNAPALDVLIIVHRDEGCGRFNRCGSPYYTWRDGQWFGADIFGLFRYLSGPGPLKVLFGYEVTNEQWQAVYKRAEADPDFPGRSAFKRGEVRIDHSIP